MKPVKKISIDKNQPNIELDKIKERLQILLSFLTILTKFPVNRNVLKYLFPMAIRESQDLGAVVSGSRT